MAKKVCSICGTQFGLLNVSNKLSDGVACEDCSKKIIDTPGKMAAYDIFSAMSAEEAKAVIASGIPIILEEAKADKKKQKLINKENAKAEKDAEKLEAKELKEKFKANGSMDCAGKFYIDKKTKQFLIPRKIGQKHQVYDFSDLENEVRSNNYRTTTETKKKGGITRGLVGGALTGGAGAIVGASTAKSRGTSYDTLSSVNFVLTFKDGRVYQFEVPAGPLGGDKAINVVDATLTSIVAENQNMVASPAEPQPSTNYDDLTKLKELVDAGVLTEEEFTAKKKQILGI